MIAEMFTPCSALLAHTLDLPWINHWPIAPVEPFFTSQWAGSNRRLFQPNPITYFPQFRTTLTGPTTQLLVSQALPSHRAVVRVLSDVIQAPVTMSLCRRCDALTAIMPPVQLQTKHNAYLTLPLSEGILPRSCNAWLALLCATQAEVG